MSTILRHLREIQQATTGNDHSVHLFCAIWCPEEKPKGDQYGSKEPQKTKWSCQDTLAHLQLSKGGVGTHYGLKNKGMISASWDNIMTLKAAVIHRSQLSSRPLQTNQQYINRTALLFTNTVTMLSLAEWPTLIDYFEENLTFFQLPSQKSLN